MKNHTENRGIKIETIKLLKMFAKNKFQEIAQKEENKRLLGALNLLAFGEMAIHNPVYTSESDNTTGLTIIIPLQSLYYNESSGDSSPARSVSESPPHYIYTEFELIERKKQFLSQITNDREPRTAKTASNNANNNNNNTTDLNLSSEWSKLQKKYPTFFRDNKVTPFEKKLILGFINKNKDITFKPCPKSCQRRIIILNEDHDTIWYNKLLINRRISSIFSFNNDTHEWHVNEEITILNNKLLA